MLNLYSCLYDNLNLPNDEQLVDIIYNDLFFVPTDYYTNQNYYNAPMPPRCKCENTRKAAFNLLLKLTAHSDSYEGVLKKLY